MKWGTVSGAISALIGGDIMRKQNYGRIVMTSYSSGL